MAEVAHIDNPLDALKAVAKHFYKERKVTIPNSPHKVSLGSLGAAQEARANARIQDFKPIHYMKAVRVEQLAYAIVEVDNVRFDSVQAAAEDTVAGEFYEAQVDSKRKILDLWPDAVVAFLFNELCELQSEVDETVGNITRTVLVPEDEPEAKPEPEGKADSGKPSPPPNPPEPDLDST